MRKDLKLTRDFCDSLIQMLLLGMSFTKYSQIRINEKWEIGRAESQEKAKSKNKTIDASLTFFSKNAKFYPILFYLGLCEVNLKYDFVYIYIFIVNGINKKSSYSQNPNRSGYLS